MSEEERDDLVLNSCEAFRNFPPSILLDFTRESMEMNNMLDHEAFISLIRNFQGTICRVQVSVFACLSSSIVSILMILNFFSEEME